MYDITRTEILNMLSEWIDIIRDYTTDQDFPIIIVGNKLDLEENRDVLKEQIGNIMQGYKNFNIMEISAKKGENVEDVFKEILRMIKNKWS